MPQSIMRWIPPWFRRVALAIGIGLGCFGLILLFRFVPLGPYDRDNYRYVISAVLQSVAALLSLVTSGSLVIIQLRTDQSPKSLDFFPTKRFLAVLIGLTIVLSVDATALLYLPTEISDLRLTLVNTLLVTNGLAVLWVISFVRLVVHWTKPQTVIKMLAQQIEWAHSDDERVDRIASLEEVAARFITRGQSNAVKGLMLECMVIIDNLKTIPSDERVDISENIRRQPLIALSDTLVRLIKHMGRNNLDDLIPHTAMLFGNLSGYGRDWSGRQIYRAVVAMTIRRSVEACLEASLETSAFNFIGKLRDQVDDDNADVVIPAFIYTLTQSIEEQNIILVSQLLDAVSRLFEQIQDLPAWVLLQAKEAVGKVDSCPALLPKRGWFESRTIAHQVRELTAELQAYKAKARA